MRRVSKRRQLRCSLMQIKLYARLHVGVEQPVLNRQPYQRGHIGHAELGHQATAVGGHRLGREVKFQTDA